MLINTENYVIIEKENGRYEILQKTVSMSDNMWYTKDVTAQFLNPAMMEVLQVLSQQEAEEREAQSITAGLSDLIQTIAKYENLPVQLMHLSRGVMDSDFIGKTTLKSEKEQNAQEDIQKSNPIIIVDMMKDFVSDDHRSTSSLIFHPKHKI